MKKVDQIYDYMKQHQDGEITASQIAEILELDRTNASRYLNKLCQEGRVIKLSGRPVRYVLAEMRTSQLPTDRRESAQKEQEERHLYNREVSSPKPEYNLSERKFSLDMLIGASKSLNVPIQQAKAAILYPPRGLHTLILGETGVGKSMFAELMYQFAKEAHMLRENAPFVRFNCADYGENPQLLMAQIFGVKKGAYTGAEKDRDGLLKKADQGILFLDEVHRLSNQGQEMLFTFIDKGQFSRLGDSEERQSAEVQIIAATTEEPESVLLKTFTRRIPMTIKLPPLKERGLKDRYKLIETFIKEESKRLSKSIYINRNALESMLLYECPSNIGQLKSDIQLSCAKAFLNFKSQRKNYILIEQSDLPQQVKKGSMKIKEHRQKLEKLLKYQEDIYKFYYDEEDTYLNEGLLREPHFYESIENRLEDLRAEGKTEEEITQIMSLDIELHFQKYIVEIPEQYKKEEIGKVVDSEIVDITGEILTYAQDRLNKVYDEKIYFGLALHLQGSIERIKSHRSIYHPKLNVIRVNYPDEFVVAMEIAKRIDQTFEIETPLDEIGYLAMFLASNPYTMEGEIEDLVGVLLIMHGNSTATSMAQVINDLVGTEHCEALDMPLSMRPEVMYDMAKTKVEKINKGRGVLILVDMGSLTSFGEMIYEETGILTKTLDKASTPTVLDACRKAVLGRDLIEIYNSCLELSGNVIKARRHPKKPLIITACFTGEGASEKLRQIIEDRLELDAVYQIISLNLMDRREFVSMVDFYKDAYDVLAIVGTVEIEVDGIPYISAVDLLSGVGIEVLREIIEREDLFYKIEQSLGAHIKSVNSTTLLSRVRHFIERTEKVLKVNIDQDVKVGIALHLSFLVDNLVQKIVSKPKTELDEFMSQYSLEMELIHNELISLEQNYEIRFSTSDQTYILKMFLANSE
ncbi:sigma 54-interacting transcriptional regulator [Fusibacter sp. 3D3]|uniref:sigma 54-interacting transcriptional regulator n=1 Tax=Fusibacter sp. 3D3 TaxID=1048380 RepID=UPI000853C3F6|nr:sigma-54-dependent transcriptional regulator [Fusibacter sp. 3D3]GAU76288.1 NtrC family transcriptional regulator [Fusibacter sp. 3D3]